MSNVRPVVLCGGAGSRLWPSSRPDRPKPLLALAGERSMLADTLERVSGHREPWVVCGAAHADAIAVEAPGRRRLVEPVPRGTGPACIVAALLAVEQDPDAVLLVVPADHAVAPVEAFRASVARALRAAEAGFLVVFGVQPRGPLPGYGWITPGETLAEAPDARAVDRFVEKPGSAQARELFGSGCAWNSGMFVARADRLLEEARRWMPEDVAFAAAGLFEAERAGHELRLGPSFARCSDQSFDVGVMQRTARGAVVPATFRWADLGTWASVIEARGASGPQVLSDGQEVRVLGDLDVLVVATGGAVLVTTADRAHEVSRFPHPEPAVLDRGPGWSVERRLVQAGRTWDGGGTAVVLAGAATASGVSYGPGAVLPVGAVATRPSTWLVAVTPEAG